MIRAIFDRKCWFAALLLLGTPLFASAKRLESANHSGTSQPNTAPPAITTAFGSPRIQLRKPASLQESGTISGVVLDEVQNPVAGAVVTVSGVSAGGGGTVTADRQGRYTVRGIAAGPFQVIATSADLRQAGEAHGLLQRGEESLSLSITLGPSATLTGTVRESNGGVPAANSQVTLSNGLTAIADRNGNYVFHFVPLGSYSITTTDSTGARHGQGTISLTSQDEVRSADIELNQHQVAVTTPLTFTITNPNPGTALSEIEFTNVLPEGLLVASPSRFHGDCNGTVTAADGAGSISLSGATLAGGSSCSFSINVTGVRAGAHTNSAGPVSALESGPGAVSNQSILVVVSPPSITKSFSAATAPLNSSVTLTFTITNPNGATDLTGVSLNDNLPSGLIIANPDSLTGTCDPGVITPAVTSINLVGGTILAGSSCTFSIDVLAISGGTQVNVTDPVTSNEGGTGGTATASVDVPLPDLTITKTHTGNFAQGQAGATYTITVTNVSPATTTAAVTVTDNLPAGLTATAIGGAGWDCPTLTSCSRGDGLDPGLSFPPITLTVNVSVTAAAAVTNTATVSGGGDSNAGNNSASDPTTITALTVAPLTITTTTSSVTIPSGNAALVVFQVNSASTTLGPINFSCTGLPAGATCSFDSQGETLSSAQVKLTINTALPQTSGLSHRPGALIFIAATIFFPLAGLVSIGRKRRRVVLAACAGCLFLLLSMAGCGVSPHINTIAKGTYAITVTATSSATPSVQANTKITLVLN